MNSKTIVFINLGSFDLHTTSQGIDIETCVASQEQSQGMLLEISASPCEEEPHKIQLPFLGDLSDVTWRFSTTDSDAMKVTFKLFQCTAEGQPQVLIGSAIAILGSIKGWFRPERQSLRRDSTVALSNPDGTFVGTVTFTFLVCQPYNILGTPKPVQKMRSLKSTQVVGHRGTSC
jgi:hypothetical protein